jgi:hypothetical protein
MSFPTGMAVSSPEMTSSLDNTHYRHPLEASKSWDLYLQRRRQQQQQEQQQQGHRILKKKKKGKKEKKDQVETEPSFGDDDLDIEISHTSRHKIPSAGGSSMHAMMIDAGSVSLNNLVGESGEEVCGCCMKTVR